MLLFSGSFNFRFSRCMSFVKLLLLFVSYIFGVFWPALPLLLFCCLIFLLFVGFGHFLICTQFFFVGWTTLSCGFWGSCITSLFFHVFLPLIAHYRCYWVVLLYTSRCFCLSFFLSCVSQYGQLFLVSFLFCIFHYWQLFLDSFLWCVF